jgi:hypothetical protein
MKRLRLAPWIVAWILSAVSCGAFADDADTLHSKYDSLRNTLADNPFHQPVAIESTQAAGDLKGDVYAVVERPFAVLEPALQAMSHWCDLLILHLNVKDCSSAGEPPNEVLTLVVGRKIEQDLSDAYQLDFRYRVVSATKEFLRVQMNAEAGPVGTHDYRLSFEAVPLDAAHSFVHLSYAYAYGLAARMATQTYLSTIGRDKVGFSVASKGADGQPVFIDGIRGVLERNTMRYYLAIQAYLDSLNVPPAQQAEKRLHDWFAATERYPRQLHELTAEEYLTMKRSELQRQKASGGGGKTN